MMPASGQDQSERTVVLVKATGIAGRVVSILPFVAVSLVPLALLLFAHHRLAVDVPYGGDDWWFLETLYFPWSEGRVSVSDLFALHHEHRHGIPFLLMLGVAYLSGCSVAAQQLAFVGCLLTILAILWREAGPVVGSRRYFVLLPLAFLALGLRQWEQIAWVGFGLTFAVPLLLSVSVFAALASVSRSASERHRRMCLASAVLFAIGASTSGAFGLLVWPIGLLQIVLVVRPRRERWLWPSAWLAMGLLTTSLYLRGWRPVGPSRPSMSVGALADWFITCLGSSLVDELFAARVVGVMILVMALVAVVGCIRERRLGEASFWIACLTFFLSTLVVTALGRAGYGLGFAVTSRYATFGLLFSSSIYVLLLPGPNRPRMRRALLAAGLACLTVLGVGRTFLQMVTEPGFSFRREGLRLAALQIYSHDAWSDEELVRAVDAPADRIRRVSRLLEAKRLGVFRWMPHEVRQVSVVSTGPDAVVSGAGRVSAVVETDVRARWLLVRGCVMLRRTGLPADDVFVSIDDRLRRTFRGLSCPEEASPELKQTGAGFSLAVPLASLWPAKDVEVSARLRTPTGKDLAFYGPVEVAVEDRPTTKVEAGE
jgi:hypothetical protein